MRPSVLIVEPREDRRRVLSRGLAEHAYEAVPAAGVEDGLKFLRGLGPSIVVVSGELAAEPSVLERFVEVEGGERTLLLVGERAEAPAELPEDVYYLAARGLEPGELVSRLLVVLAGRELGIEADVDLRSLVGEVALVPVLELVRSLGRVELSGRLEFSSGEIRLDRGRVISARAGKVGGVKAFCRLGRLQEGPFHLHLETPGGEPEIELEPAELILKAIEDAQIELPDPRAKLRVSESILDSTEIGSQQRHLLEVVDRCRTVSELFDALPAPDGRISDALGKLVERGAVELVPYRADVTIVTDSTCDLPPDLVREHGIQVVPLSVIFGEHTFRDGVDLQPRHFYELLESSDDHPRTEPPQPAEFAEQYRSLLVHQDVVSVHISEKLSQTAVHAREAAMGAVKSLVGELPPDRGNFALEVVDGNTVSLGTGLLALFGARMALRGEGVYSIVQRLEAIAPRMHILFVVDSLDYLQRGGRIGKARAVVGKLLGVKPILGVVDGEVALVDKVVGGRKAQPRIVKLFGEKIEAGKPVMTAVAHAKAPVWGDRLRKLLAESFEVREMLVTDIGPVVGTHAGPGCVGAALFQPTEEEWALIAPLEENEDR